MSDANNCTSGFHVRFQIGDSGGMGDSEGKGVNVKGGGKGGSSELQKLATSSCRREILPCSLERLLHLPAMFEVNSNF